MIQFIARVVASIWVVILTVLLVPLLVFVGALTSGFEAPRFLMRYLSRQMACR